MLLSFVSTTFQGFFEARAKNVKIFVGFLEYEKTRLFGFEIYSPLSKLEILILKVIKCNFYNPSASLIDTQYQLLEDRNVDNFFETVSTFHFRFMYEFLVKCRQIKCCLSQRTKIQPFVIYLNSKRIFSTHYKNSLNQRTNFYYEIILAVQLLFWSEFCVHILEKLRWQLSRIFNIYDVMQADFFRNLNFEPPVYEK